MNPIARAHSSTSRGIIEPGPSPVEHRVVANPTESLQGLLADYLTQGPETQKQRRFAKVSESLKRTLASGICLSQYIDLNEGSVTVKDFPNNVQDQAAILNALLTGHGQKGYKKESAFREAFKELVNGGAFPQLEWKKGKVKATATMRDLTFSLPLTSSTEQSSGLTSLAARSPEERLSESDQAASERTDRVSVENCPDVLKPFTSISGEEATENVVTQFGSANSIDEGNEQETLDPSNPFFDDAGGESAVSVVTVSDPTYSVDDSGYKTTSVKSTSSSHFNFENTIAKLFDKVKEALEDYVKDQMGKLSTKRLQKLERDLQKIDEDYLTLDTKNGGIDVKTYPKDSEALAAFFNALLINHGGAAKSTLTRKVRALIDNEFQDYLKWVGSKVIAKTPLAEHEIVQYADTTRIDRQSNTAAITRLLNLNGAGVAELRKKHIEQALQQYAKKQGHVLKDRKNNFNLSTNHSSEINRITQKLNQTFSKLQIAFDKTNGNVKINGSVPESSKDFIQLLNIIIGADEASPKHQHNKAVSSLVTLLSSFSTRDDLTSVFEGIGLSRIHKDGLTKEIRVRFVELEKKVNKKIVEENNQFILIEDKDIKHIGKADSSNDILEKVKNYNETANALNSIFYGKRYNNAIKNISERLALLFPSKKPFSDPEKYMINDFKLIGIGELNDRILSYKEISQYKEKKISHDSIIKEANQKIKRFVDDLIMVGDNFSSTNIHVPSVTLDTAKNILTQLKSKNTHYKQFVNTASGEKPSSYEKFKARFFSFVANRSNWIPVIYAEKTALLNDLQTILAACDAFNKHTDLKLDTWKLREGPAGSVVITRGIEKMLENLEKDISLFKFGFGKAKRVAFERYIAHEFGIDKSMLVYFKTHPKKTGLFGKFR